MMMSANFPFHPMHFSSNPFAAFNSHSQTHTNSTATTQPAIGMDSHTHLSLAASPSHSQVHDYSDSLSVSHSAFHFPSSNRITANEFGCDTLEVEDTIQGNQQAHIPNPFAAFTPFSNNSQNTSVTGFSSSLSSSASNAPFNFANTFQQASQTSNAPSNASTPFSFSQQQNAATSSSLSPFTSSNAQNSGFNLSMGQQTNNKFNKLFGSHSDAPTAHSNATRMSSPSPTASPVSPTPSSSSTTTSASSSSGSASYYNINIPAEVLERRPALAKLLGKRRLECLDSPAILPAFQQPKLARTDENSTGKSQSTTANDDEKENLSKNEIQSKDEVNSSSQMQEEIKKPSAAALLSTTRPSSGAAGTSSSLSTLAPAARANRRRRAEDMDTAASSSSSAGGMKRLRNDSELRTDNVVRVREQPNPFPAHDYSKDESVLLDVPRSKKLNASGEPVYTLSQMKKIIFERLKAQEKKLREEYDSLFNELAADLFDNMTSFNRDYLDKDMASKQENQTYYT